ncbi:lipopolysaccharide biosynthesis protein [Novosphingobium colocasiae]|nr:hypothetical protein [Novosphingobium colocasiae]
MLAFSNLARAGSCVLPVPLLYRDHGAPGAAFWLLATTMIGMQNLLLLGAPQIFIRMLAVAQVGAGRQPSSSAGAAPSMADIRALMHRVFLAATVAITVLMATAGSHFVAPVIAASVRPDDMWAAWSVIVASAPLRTALLCHLTYLNGCGVLARPRLIDGIGWALSGLLAMIALRFSGSLLVMAIIAQVPIMAATIANGYLARRHGWTGWQEPRTARLGPTARVIWPPTWRAGLGVLLSTGVRQGSGVLLAKYVSAGTLAGYLLALNGIAVIMMLSAVPVQSALHRMVQAFAAERTQAHVAIAAIAMRRSLWVAALLCGILALATPLLARWQPHHPFVSLPVWSVMAAGLFLQRYGAVHLQHYSITNHIVWHWLDGATGLVNLALCLWWIPGHGALGAAWANTLSLLVCYAWLPTVMAVRRFGMEWPACDLDAAVRPAAGLAMLIGAAFLLQRMV